MQIAGNATWSRIIIFPSLYALRVPAHPRMREELKHASSAVRARVRAGAGAGGTIPGVRSARQLAARQRQFWRICLHGQTSMVYVKQTAAAARAPAFLSYCLWAYKGVGLPWVGNLAPTLIANVKLLAPGTWDLGLTNTV